MVASPLQSPPQAPAHDAAAAAAAEAAATDAAATDAASLTYMTDENSQLPKGQCRYILMIPELKGQRCGCTFFDHNTARPGATCHCGHLSCFHITSAESTSPPPGLNRADMESVKQRISVLEDVVDQDGHDRLSAVVGRISQLEETVESYKDDAQTDIKAAFRNSHSAWQMVEKLETRLKGFETMFQVQADNLARTAKELEYLRNRQLELVDVNEILEERIQTLESTDPSEVALPPPRDAFEQTPTPTTSDKSHRLPLPQPPSTAPFASTAVNARPWTIHISLMPSKWRPFPFEKDTTAYRRCLSRGLHRMVAIDGDDAESFTTAVTKAFALILQGRPWMPMQARICDAAKLQGLPMLRPLEPKLAHGQYDRTFLRQHCAVIDAGGKMESLYIAMEHDALSWALLKRASVYTENLESSWDYDALLDKPADPETGIMSQPMCGNDEEEDDDESGSDEEDGIEGKTPPASTIITQFTFLKRPASEVSRSSGFDDTEGARKVPRTCKSRMIEVQRGVETAL